MMGVVPKACEEGEEVRKSENVKHSLTLTLILLQDLLYSKIRSPTFPAEACGWWSVPFLLRHNSSCYRVEW